MMHVFDPFQIPNSMSLLFEIMEVEILKCISKLVSLSAHLK